MDRTKVQRFLFILIFFNCCLAICITSVSLSTENWAVVKPYRQLGNRNEAALPAWLTQQLSPKSPLIDGSNASGLVVVLKNDTENDYLIDASGLSEEEEDKDDFPLIDLNAKKDCIRYNGRIKLGLFNGVWLLNYAFGCKNRINRVSSNRKIFFS